jgi:ribosomal protein L37AE/L43A
MPRLSKGSEEAIAHMLKMRGMRKNGPRKKKVVPVEEIHIEEEEFPLVDKPAKIKRSSKKIPRCPHCGSPMV